MDCDLLLIEAYECVEIADEATTKGTKVSRFQKYFALSSAIAHFCFTLQKFKLIDEDIRRIQNICDQSLYGKFRGR